MKSFAEPRVKLSPTKLASKLLPFFHMFIEHGSTKTCSQLLRARHPIVAQKELTYVLTHYKEIDWNDLAIAEPFQFYLVMATILEDLKEFDRYNAIISSWEQEANTPKQEPARRLDSGFVYLIQAHTNDPLYKIGLTKDPDRRVKSFVASLPFGVSVLHLIKTDDMRGLEKSLHNKYEEKRVNGEWFALSQDNVAEICSIKGIE